MKLRLVFIKKVSWVNNPDRSKKLKKSAICDGANDLMTIDSMSCSPRCIYLLQLFFWSYGKIEFTFATQLQKQNSCCKKLDA